MVSERSLMEAFKSGFEGVHAWSVFVDGGLEGFNLDWFVSWLEDDFWQEADGIAQLSLVKEQSEFCYLSSCVDFEDASESVNPFFDLLFGVGLGASKSAMGDELRNRAVFEIFLSGAGLDVDGDGGLTAWPVLGGDSDSVAEFTDGCGSWALESIWDFSEG